ncbi:MAG TPA: T9SS type A sorting domain-containing protein [Puia sp.]|nr:T9SS type A sorting domain-containing protein [Puia sp.]
MQSYIPLIRKKVGLVLVATLISGAALRAQSTTGYSNQDTKAYDTTLSSDGFGVYHLQFPQFSPDSGTLVSVRISALTNTMYGFTLRNSDSVAETYTLAVGLQDKFSGAALPAPYANVSSQSLGDYPLSAGQEVTQAPVSLLKNHVSTDTVNVVANFLGSGNVSLQYQAFTFTNLNSANHADYYYSAGITNTMTFTVQYVYSRGPALLAAGLSGWMAMPTGQRSVQLNWNTENETAGRQYVIQRSHNSSDNFTDIATLPATADGNTAHYRYPDELPLGLGNAPDDGGWYYRLKITDQTGQETYSQIRVVRTTAGGHGIQVYPNPATSFVNVVPDQPQASDWQVDIVAASGEVVQRNVFMQSATMTVNFQNKLAAGTYFVRATDLKGKSSVLSEFIIP